MQSFIITIKEDTIEATGPDGVRVEPQPFTWQPTPELAPTLAQLADESSRVPPEAVKKLGGALYDALFSREIAVAFSQAQSKVGEKNLRIRLQIEPPELAALPWEAMRNREVWLALDGGTPLVRMLAEGASGNFETLEINKPLRILFIGASPANLDKLDVDGQYQQLQKQLAEPLTKKDVALTSLFHPTQEQLRRELLKDYHIIYFAGHGAPAKTETSFDGTTKHTPASIYIDDGSKQSSELSVPTPGQAYPLTAETLAAMLKGRRNTRLVFLGACNTSAIKQSSDDYDSVMLSGFAQDLTHQAKLPAMVAMQYFISDKQAIPLTAHFFAAIAEFNPVDVALAEARSAIVRQGQPMGRDVFAPVIYLQAENAALFKKAWDRMAWALAAVLAVVLVVAGGVSYYQQGETTLERTNRIAAETQQAITQITAEAEAENRVFAESTAQAEATRSAVSNLTRRLANQASQLMNAELDPELSTLLAIEAVRTTKDYDDSYTLQAEEVLRRAVQTRLLATLSHNSHVEKAVFNTIGNRIVTRTDDGKYHLWDAESRQKLATYLHDDIYSDFYMGRFNKNGKRLLILRNGHFQLINLISGDIITTVQTFLPLNDWEDLPNFNPDGSYLPVLHVNNQAVDIINTSDGTVAFTLTDSKPISQVVFSPDNQFIVTAGGDNAIKLWDTKTKQIIKTLAEDVKITTTNPPIVFSPNSQYLITGVGGGEHVRHPSRFYDPVPYYGQIWDIPTQQPIATIDKETFFPAHIEFSPNNDDYFVNQITRWYSASSTTLWDVYGNEIYGFTTATHQEGWLFNFNKEGEQVIFRKYHDYNEASIFDVDTREEIAKWTDEDIEHVYINSNANYLLLNRKRDKSALLVDTKTGQTKSVLSPFDDIETVTFSSDNNYLVSISKDGKAKLWNINNGTSLNLPHESTVTQVEFSSDNQNFLTVSEEGEVRLWNVPSDHEPITLVGPGLDDARNVVFGPNNKSLLVTDIGQVHLWDIIQQKFVYTLSKHIVNVGHFNPSGSLLIGYTVGISDTSRIGLIDVDTGTIKMSIEGSGRAIFSENGRLLAKSGRNDIEIWDIDTESRIANLSHTTRTLAIAFYEDDTQLLVGKEFGGTTLWDITTQRKVANFPDNYRVEQMVISPNKEYLCTITALDTISARSLLRLWHIPTRQQIGSWDRNSISTAIFSPDSSFLAIISGWSDFYKGSPTMGISVKPSGYFGIYLTKIEDWQELAWILPDNDKSRIRGLVFTPDSNRLLVAVESGYVEIVGTQTGETLDFLEQETAFADIAFHPDGKMVATANTDGFARLWNAETGQVVSTMHHGGQLRAIDFSPDGTHVATVGTDGTAKIWLVNIDDLLKVACNIAGRNLSHKEWQQYLGNVPYHKSCIN